LEAIGVEMHYADGPIELPPFDPGEDPIKRRLSWWHSGDAGTWWQVVDCLAAVFKQKGPFDGIIGYSQGSAVAAALAAMSIAGEFEAGIRFAIVVAGYHLKDPVGVWDPPGRISQFAAMGYITPEITDKLASYLSPSSSPKSSDHPNGWATISKVSHDHFPELRASTGKFGFKAMRSSHPAQKQKKVTAELAAGRPAMIPTTLLLFQDQSCTAASKCTFGYEVLATSDPAGAEAELHT